jgi:hypothetical protein
MQPMTPVRAAAARQMLSQSEKDQVGELLRQVQYLVSRLDLGLSGEQIGSIAATVRVTLREQIDEAVYHQRSTEYQGTPAI